MKRYIIIILIFFFQISFSQEKAKTLEEITAIVGKNIILKSDIERQFLQYKTQGYDSYGDAKCEILEDFLFQKLLLNQAELDSLEVSENRINGELEGRLKMMISQAGTTENLENFMGKSILEIREDFRKLLKNQIKQQDMQRKITEEIKITPSEVRKFYKKIPTDSMPLINTNFEISQIVKRPKISEKEKSNVKKKLRDLKKRILNGENFSTLAILYSQDPGSSKKGGELGFVSRNDLVPEFAAVAFNLKGKEVSKLVETEYGYHIIQLIERRGERINIRHILLVPKVSLEQMQKSRAELDSIRNLIIKDSISFEDAVLKFSDDENSKNNFGIMVNQRSGNSKFEEREIEPSTFYAITNLKVNAISSSFETLDKKGKQVHKILKLIKKTEKHSANMKEDYQYLQNIALETQKQKALENWIKKKQKSTYINIISENYKKCKFKNGKWIK